MWLDDEMNRPIVRPLTRVAFDVAVRELFADPGFIALDIGKGKAGGGRFSVLASRPASSFSFSGGFVTLDGHTSIDAPKAALEAFLAQATKFERDSYLPFSGGAIGYVSFEGAKALGGYDPAKGFSRFPQCSFGIYEEAAIFDHVEGSAFVVSSRADEGETERASCALTSRLQSSCRSVAEPTSVPANEALPFSYLPSDADFGLLLKDAREWLRAEVLTRVHVARSLLKPASSCTPAECYLKATRPGAARMLFTHEGAAAVVSSEAFAAVSLPKEDMGRLLSEMPSLCASGEPIERAMAFVSNHEKEHRRFYGGAFGACDGGGVIFHTVDRAACYADGAVSTTAGTEMTASSDLREVVDVIAARLESYA